MNDPAVVQVFQDTGAFLEGHFLLTSGLHTSHYIQCARLFEDPQIAEKLLKKLATAYRVGEVAWVVGPAMGGILFAYELARILKAKNAFTERVDGKMSLRRGFAIPAGSKALVAEDVLTTGGSALEVARLLESKQVDVIGIAALVDRANVQLPYPKNVLLSLNLTALPPDECESCRSGHAVIKPGSRT